jgi:hypothetical protein
MGTGRGPGRPRKTLPADEMFEEELTSSEVQYAEFLEELGPDNIICTISRFPKSGKDMEWCDDVPISDATLEGLRERYGPGKYRLIFREGRVFRGSKNIKISDFFNRNPVMAPASNGDGDKFYREMILAMIAAQRPPDVGALMTGIAAMIAANKPAVNGDSPAALLTAVTGVFQTLKGKEENPTERLRETMSLINEFKGDEKAGGDTLYSVAKDLGEKVIDAFSGGPRPPAMRSPQPLPSARPAIPPGAIPVSALPEAAGAEPAAIVPGGEEEQMRRTFIEWIRVQLAFLKDKAKAGKDVEFWVAYMFENEEEPGCAAILQALERGATFEQVLTFDPEIGADPVLKAWFQKFYDEVKHGLEEDLDTSGPRGDVSNAAVDETNGTGGQPVITSPGPGGKPRRSAKN